MLLDSWWSDENRCLSDHRRPVENIHSSSVSACAHIHLCNTEIMPKTNFKKVETKNKTKPEGAVGDGK